MATYIGSQLIELTSDPKLKQMSIATSLVTFWAHLETSTNNVSSLLHNGM